MQLSAVVLALVAAAVLSASGSASASADGARVFDRPLSVPYMNQPGSENHTAPVAATEGGEVFRLAFGRSVCAWVIDPARRPARLCACARLVVGW